MPKESITYTPIRKEKQQAYEEKQKAYETKQKLFATMKALSAERDKLKQELDASWQEVSIARDLMNDAYRETSAVWDQHKAKLEALNAKIDDAARRADILHNSMQSCFTRAHACYENGEKAEASRLSAKGHELREQRDGWNARKAELIAERQALLPPQNGFAEYRDRYCKLKDLHKEIQEKYSATKAAHEAAKAEFAEAKQECERAQARFDEIKTRDNAMWQSATCPNCGAEFRYRIDWERIPHFCKDCRAKPPPPVNRSP